MTKVWGILRGGGVAAVVGLLAAAPAAAAVLELTSKTLVEDTIPGENADVPQGCVSESSAFASAASSASAATVEAAAGAEVARADDNCPGGPSALGVGAALASFTIQPEAGESPGDPVVLCFQRRFAQHADTAGDASAESRISGISGSDPATLVLDPQGVPQTLYAAGPLVLTGGTNGSADKEQYAAVIGDEVQVDVRADAGVEVGTGGAAHAEASARMDVSVGPCPLVTPAPTASQLGIAALTAVLLALGAVRLRTE